MSLFYTKTQLKKQRDWNNARIAKYLGMPDDTQDNPHGWSRQMQLFDKDRVHKAEETLEFQLEMVELEGLRRKRSPPSQEELDMDWCEW